MAGIRMCSGVRARGGRGGFFHRAAAAGVILGVACAAAWGGERGREWGEGAVRTAELRVQDEGPDELPRLIKLLDAPDYATRHGASMAIVTDERITIDMVEAALLDPALSAEQRQRLREVQRTRFDRSPRAAMGVQFATTLLPHRVVLSMAIPPFKSAELLEPGDVILSADGVPLHSPRAFETMRTIIISHDPGDEVELEVRRAERKLTVRVPLGRYQDLNNGGALGEPDLERAWRLRLDRTREPGRELISTGLSTQDWNTMEESARERRQTRDANMQRAGMAALAPRILIAGGKPRPAFFDDGEMMKLMAFRDKDDLRLDELQWIRQQQQWEQQRRFAAIQSVNMGPTMSVEDEIKAIRAKAEEFRAEVQRLHDEAAAGLTVNADRLAATEASVVMAERVLLALTAELQDEAP